MDDIVKIIVVEDHPLMAQATAQLLNSMDRMEVVGIAGNAKECMILMEQHRPTIVFLDFQLPDIIGTQVTEEIKSLYPDTHVVVFSGIDITDLFNKFLELNVSGIISKGSGADIIQNTVNSIMNGFTLLPLSLFQQMRMITDEAAAEVILTEEEVEIMALVVNGSTHEQIAEQIHASKRSVDNYLKKIYEKFGVDSKPRAIEKFVKSKFYAMDDTGGG